MGNSQEIDLYWDMIRNSVDELVACLEGLDGDSLNWKPLDDANSLCVLATHTMGNVRHNFLSILCGGPITRDRDSEFAAMGDSVAEIEAGVERASSAGFRKPFGICRRTTSTV